MLSGKQIENNIDITLKATHIACTNLVPEQYENVVEAENRLGGIINHFLIEINLSVL